MRQYNIANIQHFVQISGQPATWCYHVITLSVHVVIFLVRQKYKLSERNAKEIVFFCFSATLLGHDAGRRWGNMG
jgi:hypothetical protein